jgi:DnaK suppressor protein
MPIYCRLTAPQTVWQRVPNRRIGDFMAVKRKKNEIEELREILLAKRDELTSRIEQRRQEILMEQEPEDEAGIAARNNSAGMAIANIDRELRTLVEIELSLRRMETGEYGICGVCGEEIPIARLNAIPWTRRCVKCAGGGIARDRGLSRLDPGFSYR